LINLGRNFDVPREKWDELTGRIEQLINGQLEFFSTKLDSEFEELAQKFSARVIRARAKLDNGRSTIEEDYQNVDVNSLEMVRPRSVGIEHVCLEALKKVGLDEELKKLCFNEPQRAAAIGTIIGRMANPGSELKIHSWLGNNSGLGELIGYDFSKTSLMSLYRISDQLLKHKEDIEDFLYKKEKTLFSFEEVITLYDLTNTYFEGGCKSNKNGAFGHSKEKRTDCPLVTLALVLDGSGFPKKSKVFPGNASEPKTLEEMVGALVDKDKKTFPTVVLDAGIATEENIEWLKVNNYKYIVVSRKRHREFNPDDAVEIKDDGNTKIQAQRKVNEETGETELYCFSSERSKKEQSINDQFTERFESALSKLEAGLHKKRTVKKYDKIVERLGRLKERYSRSAQYYDIKVKKDKSTGNAISISWKRKKEAQDPLAGVYCLRTNQDSWDEKTLWHTYTMLTDLEAVFRSLKSELGLRPVFHHKTHRVSGHLFISVLAYHLVHTIRFQLKECGIDLSWDGIRRNLDGQDRITVELKNSNGKTIHIRKATRPEPRQEIIYDALGIPDRPGKTEKTII
jgi:transposase